MSSHAGPVLIAYDGSEDAAAAIRRAGRLLGPRRAVVVRVWEPLAGLLLQTDLDGLTGTMREAAEELDSDDAKDAGRIAEEGAELAREAGFHAGARAVRGQPKAWPTLLRQADLIDAEVIVAGSRGLGGVKSALYGSVSSGLLHHSHRPLLVVPPADDTVGDGPVIVGFDGSDAAREAVSAAGRLLAAREVLVETVWRPYTPVAGGGVAGAPVAVITRAAEEIDKEIAAGARIMAEDGARLAAAAGLEARGKPVQAVGTVWRTLIHSAREQRAPAVVVGSRGRSAAGAALLGSVSSGLVHHAGVPVLVVPPPAA
jgi:nucleotide-binding universal stress UspA family protein